MKNGYFCLLRSSKQRQADLQIVLLALHPLDLTACWRGGLCDACKALDI